MTVQISPISIIRQSGAQTLFFQDSFNRANGPLGTNWNSGIQNVTGGGAPVAFPLCEIGVSAIDAGQCLKWSTFSPGVGSVYFNQMVPVPPSGLLNRSQFSQWTCVGMNITAGNDIFAGPTVMSSMGGQGIGGSDANAYIMQATSAGKVWALIRRNGTVQTGLTGAFAFNNGDVFKLVATINASDVTLTCLINGVVIQTVVDNAGTRLTSGMPGFMGASINNATANYTCEWRNFFCGPA